MSTRQNKKRKAKPTRERTVTTLTGVDEDDNPLLRPSLSFHMSMPPSVDDPSLTAKLMSSPFSIASSSGGGGGVPPAFQSMQSDYPDFAYAQFMDPMQHISHQQAQFFPNPSLPPGQSDLEVLERLKEAIKNNQHDIFRAFPRPDVLASLYQGSVNTPLSTVPPHPEQVPTNAGYQAVSNPVQLQQQALGNPGLSASGANASMDRARNGSVSWEANGKQRRASISSVGGPPSKQPNVLLFISVYDHSLTRVVPGSPAPAGLDLEHPELF
ncbi:hypothetical protein OF83DRAFT_1065995 [Amylostereum chailletii]|nr:hypothetical protein OF83DRAFT_1065995 [Amylostereum chailletii]